MTSKTTLQQKPREPADTRPDVPTHLACIGTVALQTRVRPLCFCFLKAAGGLQFVSHGLALRRCLVDVHCVATAAPPRPAVRTVGRLQLSLEICATGPSPPAVTRQLRSS